MHVTEYGAYIEEANNLEDFGDFIKFTDDHGAIVLLSKDVVRAANALLEYIETSNFTTGEQP